MEAKHPLVDGPLPPLGAEERTLDSRIGVIYSPWVEEAAPMAAALAGELRDGFEPWVCSVLDLEEHEEQARECGIFVTVGGDGTILRAVRLAAPAAIPIVGVNLGRVGYMAELEADEARERIASFARGEGWVEERTMLEAQILPPGHTGDGLPSYTGLNDAVVSRVKPSRMVYVAVRVDGYPLAYYAADAIVVATATGSTGYALAAGGPILYADAPSLIVQPVAPQLADDAAVVLHPGAVVEIEVEADQDAMVSVDGYLDLDIHPGGVIRVQESVHRTRFLRQGRKHRLPTALSRRLSSVRRVRSGDE